VSPASLPRRIQPIVYAGTEFLDIVLGGIENQFRLLASGLRLRMRMNKKESEEIKRSWLCE
jgi:hypothetical protein